MTATISRIAADTADIILAIFAGQTVTRDDVHAMITQQYELARKRPGFSSYFQVTDALERAGAVSRYEYPNYTGQCWYTFPEVAA